jgi:hypothetical protein
MVLCFGLSFKPLFHSLASPQEVEKQLLFLIQDTWAPHLEPSCFGFRVFVPGTFIFFPQGLSVFVGDFLPECSL